MRNLKTSKLLKRWTYLQQNEGDQTARRTSSKQTKEPILTPSCSIHFFFFTTITVYPRTSLQIIHDESSIGAHFWTHRDSASYNSKGRLQFKNLRIFCSEEGNWVEERSSKNCIRTCFSKLLSLAQMNDIGGIS